MPRRKKEVLDEIERRIAGSDLLSAEEKDAVREKAREHVAKARKDKALDDLLKLAIVEEEREYEPDQQMEDFYVDLPVYSPFIKINNVMYFHGIVYEVPYHKARSMADIAWRAWNHEREWKEGKSAYDAGRRPMAGNTAMSLKTGAVNRNYDAGDRVTTTQNMRERGV